MNILITAGGTAEKIDEVRKISNMATGRLGSIIADTMLNIKGIDVTYLCSEGAITPKSDRAKVMHIDNVQNLKNTLERLLREQVFDAMIHSMAISDYTVKYSVPGEELEQYLVKCLLQGNTEMKNREQLQLRLHQALSEYQGRQAASKISSDIEQLFLCLEKTPKMIRMFKQLQPQAILVGFKLLVDVDETDLLKAAEKLMKDNQCDFVLANDKRNIDADHHKGTLLGADRTKQYLNTKQEIADAITKSVVQAIKRRVDQ
jgi:phosphopantothenate-cysteine ligase